MSLALAQVERDILFPPERMADLLKTIGVTMNLTMQYGNCFKCPEAILGKMNLKSESEKYIKSENSIKQFPLETSLSLPLCYKTPFPCYSLYPWDRVSEPALSEANVVRAAERVEVRSQPVCPAPLDRAYPQSNIKSLNNHSKSAITLANFA